MEARKELTRHLEISAIPKKRWTFEHQKKFDALSLDDLFNDPYYLGAQHVGESLYPVHLEDLDYIWKHRKDGSLDLVIDISAIGTGKTTKASLILWMLTTHTLTRADPWQHFNLKYNSKLAIVMASKNAKLAKEVTFHDFLPSVNIPLYRDYFPPQVNMTAVTAARRYPQVLRFPKNLTIFPAQSGRGEAALGYNVIGWVIDEAAWGDRTDKSNRGTFSSGKYDACEEMYNALHSRQTSRLVGSADKGTGVLITSPRYVDDFVEVISKRIAENVNHEFDNAFVCKRKALWQARPAIWRGKVIWSGKYYEFDLNKYDFVNDVPVEGLFDGNPVYINDHIIKVPVELFTEFRDSPEAAVRDKASICVDSLEPFFKRRASIKYTEDVRNYAIYDSVQREYLLSPDFTPEKCQGNFKRYLHLDLSLSEDATGIACCYSPGGMVVEGNIIPIVKFDFIVEIPAVRGQEIILAEIRNKWLIELTKRGFNIALLTFDRFQSADSIQILRNEWGIKTAKLSIDASLYKPLIDINSENYIRKEQTSGKLEAWQTYRDYLYHDAIKLPVSEFPNFSLRKQMLEEEYNGNKKRVDHPSKGSHDGLQAVVGSAYNCINHELMHSRIISMESEDNDPINSITKEDIENSIRK